MVQKPIDQVEELLKPLEKLYEKDLEDDSFTTELCQWYLKWKNEKEMVNKHFLEALLLLYLSALATLVTYRFFSIFSAYFHSHLAHLKDPLVL